MGRHSLTDLKRPKRRFRSTAFPLTRKGKRFETITEAEAEDALRASSLRREAERMPARIDQGAARLLVDQLNYGEGHPPDSLASKLYMRRLRSRIGGHLWELALSDPSTRTATIFPDRKQLSREELRALNPREVMQRFRARLNRAGAAAADGYLIATLHCEFDRNSEMFQPHIHVIAAGGMIRVLDRLRKHLQWRPNDPVRTRVRITRERLTHLPHPLLYLLQGWWPARARYPAGHPSFGFMSSVKARMREPFHSEYLLWLDRWRLADLTLMMRIEVVGGRLRTKDRPRTPI